MSWQYLGNGCFRMPTPVCLIPIIDKYDLGTKRFFFLLSYNFLKWLYDHIIKDNNNQAKTFLIQIQILKSIAVYCIASIDRGLKRKDFLKTLEASWPQVGVQELKNCIFVNSSNSLACVNQRKMIQFLRKRIRTS